MTRSEESSEAGTRIVLDFKIPLWGLMVTAGTGVLLVAGLYFNVQTLTSAVQDLQITVKSGNTSFSVMSSEVALLKFRMATIEDEIRRGYDREIKTQPRKDVP